MDLEEVKFVNIVKGLGISQDNCKGVLHVKVQGKWSDKLKLKIKLNKYKWNVNSVVELDMQENKNVLFVQVKKLY